MTKVMARLLALTVIFSVFSYTARAQDDQQAWLSIAAKGKLAKENRMLVSLTFQ